MRKEEERRREKREEDQDGAGVWLLGATIMHSEKEPDVEGDRRQGAGVQAAHPGLRGLGGKGLPAARTPTGLGVWGDPAGSSSVAALTPTQRQASEMGVRVGRAEPATFVSSPQLLSLSGYNLSRTTEFKQLLKLGLKQSWGRMLNSALAALLRPPEPC